MAGADGEDRSVVGKIEVPRAADILASRLRQRILAGDLRPGDSLPPERRLVEQTGVGRASVREALRSLEAENLVESRLGRYGGWVVRRPTEDSVARSIDVFIRGREIRFETLLETREAVEPACAALAARHRTDDDLDELDRASLRLRTVIDDVPEYLVANLRWHLAVVRSSHNELLIAVMTALADAVHAGTNLEDFNSDEIRTAAVRVHDRVTDAIRDRDEAAAHRRMHRHLHAFRQEALGLSDTDPGKADRPLEPRPPRTRTRRGVGD